MLKCPRKLSFLLLAANVSQELFLPTHTASWKKHVWSASWTQATEFGQTTQRGFRGVLTCKDLHEQLSVSSLWFLACVLWTACSYLLCLSPSVSLQLTLLLSVCAGCPWCKTAFVWDIKFKGVITLFSSCENTSKQNHFVWLRLTVFVQ